MMTNPLAGERVVAGADNPPANATAPSLIATLGGGHRRARQCSMPSAR